MLAIRLQRTGRSGLAQFRMVVQDSRRSPKSGSVIANIGWFNPHSKETGLDKEKAEFYLKNGAQPSPRAARLLKAQGVKLPEWVKEPQKKERTIRNPEKLRKNRPAETEKPSEKALPEAEADEVIPQEPERESVTSEPAEPEKDMADELTDGATESAPTDGEQNK